MKKEQSSTPKNNRTQKKQSKKSHLQGKEKNLKGLKSSQYTKDSPLILRDSDKNVERKKEEYSKFSPNTTRVLTGCAAGFINGLFGGGGGMIIVPALIYLLKKQSKMAHATAIIIILPMSIISGLFYLSFGSFNISIGIPATIGVTLGGAVGAILLKRLSAGWITALFSLVMALAGVKMLFF